MITVGLTGGIGSGKTYIASLFKKLNIPVYNSDEHAKILMHNSNQIKTALIERFGNEAYLNNTLNRAFIADKVFKEKEQLAWLNNMVHPVVAHHFNDWKNEHVDACYVIKEAAILIESGAYKSCEQIIVINAEENVRIKRVLKRDNISQEQVIDRMKNQISDKERNKYANFIINNNGTENVIEEINEIHNKLLNIKL